MQGRDLFLQARVPNHIVRQFTSEVFFFQHELDAVLNKFNRKITRLQAEGKSETETAENPKKSKELSEEEKVVLLRKKEEEKKEGGGTVI